MKIFASSLLLSLHGKSIHIRSKNAFFCFFFIAGKFQLFLNTVYLIYIVLWYSTLPTPAPEKMGKKRRSSYASARTYPVPYGPEVQQCKATMFAGDYMVRGGPPPPFIYTLPNCGENWQNWKSFCHHSPSFPSPSAHTDRAKTLSLCHKVENEN
jgi:hypothetical protein